jgi:hypothetical protein
MSLNSIIINALEPLGVLVRFQDLLKEDGTPNTYITFFEYNQSGSVYADDVEQETTHYIQVDIWSKGNYNELSDQVKQRLKEIGFTRLTEAELFEKDTRIYHKVSRFSFSNSL